MVQGNFEDARYLYECILALHTRRDYQQYIASSGDHEAQAQREAENQALLWREIGNTWSATGEYARAYECYGRGKEVMRSAGISTGIAWACLHLQYGMLLRLDGHYYEARRYLQEALDMLEMSIHSSGATALMQGPESTSADGQSGQSQKELHTRIERTLRGDSSELGNAHDSLGIALASMGPLSEGLKHLHVALTIYEEGEFLSEVARVCSNLGAVYMAKGEQVPAREYLRRSLDLAERIGDLPNMVIVTGNLGDVAQRTGALLEAKEWFQRSLELAERVNDREGISWSSSELANVQRDLGELTEARKCILLAIKTGRAIKSPRCIRYALVALGELRLVEAMRVCTSTGADQSGHSTHAGQCRGLLHRAKSTLQRALSLDELEVESSSEGKYLLATVCYLLDEGKIARQMALQTLKAAQENEIGRVEGRVNRLLGRILASEGYYEQATLYFEQALVLFRENGSRLDYARTLSNFGAVLVRESARMGSEVGGAERRSMCQRGRAFLNEAHQIFVDCGAAIDVLWTEALIDSL